MASLLPTIDGEENVLSSFAVALSVLFVYALVYFQSD